MEYLSIFSPSLCCSTFKTNKQTVNLPKKKKEGFDLESEMNLLEVKVGEWKLQDQQRSSGPTVQTQQDAFQRASGFVSWL